MIILQTFFALRCVFATLCSRLKKNYFVVWFLWKILYAEMNLARIHSTENKFVVIILCSVQNVFTALSRQKSIFGFVVSLGAKYPCDLRSMIQFWIFPKKRTLRNFTRSHTKKYWTGNKALWLGDFDYWSFQLYLSCNNFFYFCEKMYCGNLKLFSFIVAAENWKSFVVRSDVL